MVVCILRRFIQERVLLLYLVVFVFGLFRLRVWQFLFSVFVRRGQLRGGHLSTYQLHPEAINTRAEVSKPRGSGNGSALVFAGRRIHHQSSGP